jgi:peptidoglycan glycosyltransferase
MTTNVRRLATIFTLAFIALGAYLTYWQVVVSDDLRGRMPFNAPRVQAAEERIKRGEILDRNGQRLAWTEQTAQGSRRVYAEPSLVHVVGYHSHLFGTSNIENGFNDFLLAEKGLNPFELFRKEFLYEPQAGNNVVTTIDLDLQRVADQAMGDRRGALVALNPKTGEILALVSQPYFDPNRLDELWSRIANDPARPLVNRVAGGQYAPGSTFKEVTLTSALEAGVVTPQTTFTNNGDFVVEGYRIRYTNPPDRRTFDLRDAFGFSVNAAFADIGLKLGAERLVQGAARFGFGEAPPLEGIPTAESHVSTTPRFLESRPALAATAFGQGELSVSPLQMALVAAAAANGGVVPDPYVVAQIVDPATGAVLQQDGPRGWKTAMSPDTARIVNEMMVYSVSNGLAEAAAIPGVAVAGKTGTAETGGNAEAHAWFIGYAPANDPTIAVAVISENAGQGSREAIPQARQVMQSWLGRR